MKKWLWLWLILLLPRLCWGAVAVDTSTAGACLNHAGNVLSWASSTIAGSNRYLFVAIQIDDASVSVTSVTLGAQGLGSVGEKDNGGLVRTELWGLVAPNTGSGTITVTTSAEPAYAWCAHDFALTDVNQASPIGAPVTTNANYPTSTISVDVSSVSNGLVVDVMGQEQVNSLATQSVGQTIIQQISEGNGAGVNTSYKAGTGTLTMGWDFGIDNAAQIGVLVNPVTAPTVARHGPVIQ